MQWNEGFHTIPRRPEYHKVIALFITSSPELSMLICAIQICTSSTALRMATSPMMIPVCQQHYNTLGARLPTFLCSWLADWAPPGGTSADYLSSNCSRMAAFMIRDKPYNRGLGSTFLRTAHWRFRPDALRMIQLPMIIDINVCNWICSVSLNLWGPRGQIYCI